MIGKTVSHYKIVEKLGQGGMGVVYKAEDTKLNRTVALKFLPPNALGGEEEKSRFVREAQAAAALHHPNICTVHEIDEVDGQIFMVMAFLPGTSLEDRIAEGPIALADTVEIASQIVEGLKEAHDHSVVHRDIKGANIMLTEGRRVTVMDFGLAKLAGQTTLTQEGTAVGTVAYMSPEQAQGQEVDQRTDIFSLGILLYEMIAGRRPFRADHEAAVIYSILNEAPDPLTSVRTDVPVVLEHLVDKMLAKDPALRYQNAGDLLVDLRRVHQTLGDAPSTAHDPVTPAKPEGISLMRHLLDRRVPQLFGVYLVVSFGVLQFTQWIVDRYPVSPNIPDLCLALFAAMLPTVLLVAYFHGRSGTVGWSRVEKVGIPVNVLAACAVLFVMFQGKDIGAATTTVATTDAEGNAIERVIPKGEFQKKSGLFFFDNKADSTNDWMEQGFSYALWFKFYQDTYLTTWYGFKASLDREGFDDHTKVPLALKRKIAKDYRLHYFVTGTIESGPEDALVVTADLYETQNGRKVETFRHETDDFFATVDSLSVQLRRAMKIPSYHIAESPDLPASEMFTESEEAMALYATGAKAAEVNNDHTRARKDLMRAVKLDPTFAVANWQLAIVFAGMNEPYYTKQSYKDALQHIYRLPEAFQFYVRVNYHFAHEDPEEATAELRRWVTLFPQSTLAHEQMANAHETDNELDAAISEWEIILELNPQRDYALFKISQLYLAKGEFEAALPYAERYGERMPGERGAYRALADLYLLTGDLEGNLDMCKKSVLAEPDNVASIIGLAFSYARGGNTEEAFAQIQKALGFSQSVEDSAGVYQSLQSLYAGSGQMTNALEACEKRMSLMEKVVPRAYLSFLWAQEAAPLFAAAGRTERALEMLHEAEASARDAVSRAIMGTACVSVFREIDDPAYIEEAERHIAAMDAALNMGGAEAYRWYPHDARALVAEWNGEPAQAREHYLQALTIVTKNQWYTVRDLNRRIGEACWKQGDLATAAGHLEEALKVSPFVGDVNYTIAQVYHDQDRMKEATTHLNRALDKWNNADPDFEPAEHARATRATWESEGVLVP